MLWPLPLICLTSFGVGAATEIMMVVWTVTMARNIRPGTLARVSGYDALCSMMATPAGALIAGPAALAFGVRRTQYGAAAIIVAVSGLAVRPSSPPSLSRAPGGSRPDHEGGRAARAGRGRWQ